MFYGFVKSLWGIVLLNEFYSYVFFVLFVVNKFSWFMLIGNWNDF